VLAILDVQNLLDVATEIDDFFSVTQILSTLVTALEFCWGFEILGDD